MVVIGADSETCDGPPYTFQFYSDDIRIREVIWLNEKRAAQTLCKFLNSLPRRHQSTYVIYAHNLAFDLVSFFYNRRNELLELEIDFKVGNWRFQGVYGRPTFLRGRRTDSGRSRNGARVWFIDTGAYFPGSLDNLAKLFCPHLPKLKMPSLLGQIVYPPGHKKFYNYALRDAEIAYHIGHAIQKFHEDWDVQQSVSVPHIAARIFRHDYLRATIPLPPMCIVYSALHSYHGGKNGITCRPGFHRRVYSLDITSAYPFAMSRLPSFSDINLYRACEGDSRVQHVPDTGIYKIFGQAKECRWPILFSHSFKPLFGRIEGVWVTGYELNEALRAKEFKLEKFTGYYYDAGADPEPSPFAAFVKEFFRLKNTAPSKIHRTFYKLILNSLYGKFIQTTKRSTFGADLAFDIDEQTLYQELDLVAGGLFNPFIASLITGSTRALVHRLEHKYKAMHTSTDGIFTRQRPKTRAGLGGLEIDQRGDVLILRNKLYAFYSNRNINGAARASAVFKDKYITKFALHGFRGNLATMEALAVTGERSYHYVKVNKLRESRQRGLQVNRFQDYTAQLKLKGENDARVRRGKSSTREKGTGRRTTKRSTAR